MLKFGKIELPGGYHFHYLSGAGGEISGFIERDSDGKAMPGTHGWYRTTDAKAAAELAYEALTAPREHLRKNPAKREKFTVKESRTKNGNVQFFIREAGEPHSIIETPIKHRRYAKRFVRQKTGRGVRINPDSYPKTRGARNAIRAWRGSAKMVRVEMKAPRAKAWQTAYIMPDTPQNRERAQEQAESLSRLLVTGAKLRVTVK